MAKIELDIKVEKGRVTLKGKRYDELSPDEQMLMDGLLKGLKSETE